MPRRRIWSPDEYDEAAVLRLMQGELLPLHRWDRIEAVRRLVAGGHSDREVAERLHVHPRQVTRDKAALGLTKPRPTGAPYRLTRKALMALAE